MVMFFALIKLTAHTNWKEDAYVLKLDTMNWSTISVSVPNWIAVGYINAVYSSASTSVHIWGGSTASYAQQSQMLTIAVNGSTSVVANIGVAMDSYTGINVAGSILFYGGHVDAYYNTLYDYEVSSKQYIC
jgi:hypothetical protein